MDPAEVSDFVEAATDRVMEVISDDGEERGILSCLYTQPGWAQMVAGSIPGWLSGYFLAKVGKMAATAVGGGALLLLILSRQGYVTVHWRKLKRDTVRTQRRLPMLIGQTSTQQRILSRVRREMIIHRSLTSGFTIGFVLGFFM